LTPPRKARLSEYDQLVSFLSSIFGMRMDLVYCHIYKPTQKDMANNIVILDDGHIVSCVGIFPLTFICGEASLSVGGIGGVSTEPRYRGRGLMTRLLDKSISIMKQQNYDISILWGDRRRYGHFGWENAGRQYVFTIDRRHVPPGKAGDGEIRPLSPSSDELGRIARLYEQWKLRVHRTPAQVKSVFRRHMFDTWVWTKGRAFAYMTIRRTTKIPELMEFGGDLPGLDELLSFVFKEYQLETLAGRMAVSRSPYLPFTIRRSSEWGVRFIGMVKILSLCSVLEKFSTQIGKKCRGLGLKGALTLQMTDSGQVATLHFGTSLTVSERKSKPTLALSDTEMVRLVFGTIPPSHSLGLDRSLGYLDAIFPLDFFVSGLDYV